MVKKGLPYTHSEPILFQLMPVVSHPATTHICAEPGSSYIDAPVAMQVPVAGGAQSLLFEELEICSQDGFGALSGHVSSLGDAPPVLMNPLSQSQFVPLAEVLCCTISEMNADHVMVTQETLTEQLVKNYPGIAVPSHKIVYNTLGTLIKERKIYHTGEGYFIVTPSTYFITHDAPEANKRVQLGDSCCSSPSITYLVSIENCAELMKENIPMVSCYRSHHCFPDKDMFCEQRHQQLMNHEPNGGGKKGCSELKPSIQNQVVSTPGETHSWDTTKSLTRVKEKLKCKRFGFGLFWRSSSKKEKRRKEYSTFSAQFPPKEWPVRDEDDLDNIPRDIEHEIIKRINPTLTVDNLIKHTALMQKFEEQKNYISKGTSAEALTVRQKHLSKECPQKTQNKTAKHGRKNKSSKEKQISRSNRKSQIQELTSQSEKLEEHPSLHTTNQHVESQAIYKRQIKNPFQGLSRKHNFHVKGHKGQINTQLKPRTQKQERGLQRPRSSDSSKLFEYEAEQLVTEKQADKAKPNKSLHVNRSSLQLKKDSLSENISYAQGNTLQIDDKSKYLMESSISEDSICRQTAKQNAAAVQKSSHTYTEDNVRCKEDAKYSLNPKDEHCKYKADSACKLLDQTSNEFQNVSLSNYTTNANLLKKAGVKYRKKTGKKKELIFKYDCTSWPGSTKLEGEGFTDDCHLVYQKAHDGNTCSSFYLDDNFEYSESVHLQPGQAVPKAETVVSVKNWKVNIHPDQYNTTVNKCDSGEYEYKECASLAESIDGSKVCQKTDFTEESCFCSRVLLTIHKKEEETGLTACVKTSAVTNLCNANEAGSDIDALQNSIYAMGEELACCALGLQAKEMRNPLMKNGLIFNNACTVILGQNHLEGIENHSITGDSGIDSPRTQSLTPNNSTILDGLKRRQSFLENFESINSIAIAEGRLQKIPCC
ncbi:storkhead-box protein 1 [Rhea pennata]|uniref:storkhead-box protein 1 n=1 Tax=Rhea pennata TaxID=8795 RepID=UPI002E273FDD